MQVSRSIGDAYLKKDEFNREPLPHKFRLPEPFFKPILNYEPSISVHKLRPEDQFLIFASDGLWEQLSNQEVVNIVSTNPRNVRFLPLCPFKDVHLPCKTAFWILMVRDSCNRELRSGLWKLHLEKQLGREKWESRTCKRLNKEWEDTSTMILQLLLYF